MFSADDLGDLQKLLSQLGLGSENAQSGQENKQNKHNNKDQGNKQYKHNNDRSNGSGVNCPKLDPAQILAIGGLLSGALVVRSVWVNNDQTVQFVLSGNLKRETQLDKVMGLIGQLPFEQVIKAIMDNNT